MPPKRSGVVDQLSDYSRPVARASGANAHAFARRPIACSTSAQPRLAAVERPLPGAEPIVGAPVPSGAFQLPRIVASPGTLGQAGS
jgi:hypothetical protein